jgi:hypothetical protein
LTLFFALLGSAFVKAKQKMLVKLTQAERVEEVKKNLTNLRKKFCESPPWNLKPRKKTGDEICCCFILIENVSLFLEVFFQKLLRTPSKKYIPTVKLTANKF